MEAYLQKRTIKQKIRLGFAVIWAVLAIITLQAVINLVLVRSNIQQVVQEKQPMVMAASKLEVNLQRAIHAFDQYLVTQNESLFASYQQHFILAQNSLTQLQSTVDGVADKSVYQAELQVIRENFAKLPDFAAQIQTFLNDENKQFPAFLIVNGSMAQSAQQVESHLNDLLAAEMQSFLPERQLILKDILKLRANWLSVSGSVNGFIAFRKLKFVNDAEHHLDAFEAALEKLQGESWSQFDVRQQQTINATMERYFSYREDFMRVKQIHQGPQWRMDTWLMTTEVSPVINHIEHALESIVQSSMNAMIKTSEEVVDASLRNLLLLLLFSVIGQLVGMWVSNKITRSVVNPVADMVDAFKGIAYGKGDLTHRLTVKGEDELAQMATSFNEFVNKIQKALQQVTLTVNDLESSSTKLIAGTLETRGDVEHQLSVSKQLSHSIGNMAEQSRNVEDHSLNSSKATEQAVSRVKEGGKVVASASDQIQLVAKGMQEITDSVMQLNDDSQTISTVVNVIREIAEQTNLLALNAAIEAARAGEYGRGFAVVADEVRGLAKRTQESTLQIERVIEKIQKATQDTVVVVEAGQKITQVGYERVMHAQQVLSPVVVLMDDINSMSGQMLASAQSQSDLAQEVREQIVQINSVSQNTMQGVRNNEAEGHQLQQVANQLKGLLAHFRI